jgi:hypothetical protein
MHLIFPTDDQQSIRFALLLSFTLCCEPTLLKAKTKRHFDVCNFLGFSPRWYSFGALPSLSPLILSLFLPNRPFVSSS